MPRSEKFQQLPAPWDRIFALTTRLFVWGLLHHDALHPAAVLPADLPHVRLRLHPEPRGRRAWSTGSRTASYRVTASSSLIFLGVIVGTLYFLAPHVRNQMGEFTDNYDTYIQQADAAIYKWIDDNPGGEVDHRGRPQEGPRRRTAIPRRARIPLRARRSSDRSKPRPPIIKPFILSLLQGPGGNTDRQTRPPGGQGRPQGVRRAVPDDHRWPHRRHLVVPAVDPVLLPDRPRPAGAEPRASAASPPPSSTSSTTRPRTTCTSSASASDVPWRRSCSSRSATRSSPPSASTTWSLPSIVFLSAIVFFCSFIPVAGVFISSAPICSALPADRRRLPDPEDAAGDRDDHRHPRHRGLHPQPQDLRPPPAHELGVGADHPHRSPARSSASGGWCSACRSCSTSSPPRSAAPTTR